MKSEFNSFQKYIIRKTVLLSVPALIIAFLMRRADFAYGLAVGTIISILNLRLTAASIMRIADEKVAGIKPYLFNRYLIIYAICGAALFIAVNKGMAIFWGTFLGLLMVKIALFAGIVFSKAD